MSFEQTQDIITMADGKHELAVFLGTSISILAPMVSEATKLWTENNEPTLERKIKLNSFANFSSQAPKKKQRTHMILQQLNTEGSMR